MNVFHKSKDECIIAHCQCAGQIYLENEPARPMAARPVSHDAGGQAAGESAVRRERRGQDRRTSEKQAAYNIVYNGHDIVSSQ